MLIAVPIPKEHSASGSLIESAIQTALKEARWSGFLPMHNLDWIFLLIVFRAHFLYILKWSRIRRDKNITGNAATPFLLGRVNELTGGASLASSILYLFLLTTILPYLYSQSKYMLVTQPNLSIMEADLKRFIRHCNTNNIALVDVVWYPL